MWRQPPFVLAALAGAAVGLTAEWSLYSWSDVRQWAPDLVTGWTLIACGLVAVRHRRGAQPSGSLLAAAGFAWFAGNFQATGIGAVDWVSAHAAHLHLALLVQLVVAFPRGRPTRRLDRVAIGAGYAFAALPPLWRSEPAAIVLACFVAVVAARGYRRAVGVERRRRRYAVQVTLLLAATVAGVGAARLAVVSAGIWQATLAAYEVGLGAVAVAVLVALVHARWERAAVTDLVVELGEAVSATVRDELARALGDPNLQVGYRLPGRGAYVDFAGRPLALPDARSRLVVTRFERDGDEVAVLVHDPAVLDDPSLLDGVAAAARLGAANARLQAEVRERVDDVAASRRRLVAAGNDERRDLEQRLDEGARRRLDAVSDLLAAARARADATTAAAVARADTQLVRTQAEITELAAGLHPRELALHGLGPSLRALAERTPVPVDVDVRTGRLPPEVEVAAFFVCSEALANVVKHASASSVRVLVAVDDRGVRLEIADDGVGGADPARGTGLRGLADRVDAAGGTLAIDSGVGGGTRLVVELPLEAR